jgi:hypothetical protein
MSTSGKPLESSQESQLKAYRERIGEQVLQSNDVKIQCYTVQGTELVWREKARLDAEGNGLNLYSSPFASMESRGPRCSTGFGASDKRVTEDTLMRSRFQPRATPAGDRSLLLRAANQTINGIYHFQVLTHSTSKPAKASGPG